MKGGMIVAKKDMSALLGGLANKSEKEQAAKELDNKAKSIKGKPIRTDKQKK